MISRNTADRIKNNIRHVYQTKSVITFFIAIGKPEEFKNYVRPEGYVEKKSNKLISWKTFWVGYSLGIASIIIIIIMLSMLFGAK